MEWLKIPSHYSRDMATNETRNIPYFLGDKITMRLGNML